MIFLKAINKIKKSDLLWHPLVVLSVGFVLFFVFKSFYSLYSDYQTSRNIITDSENAKPSNQNYDSNYKEEIQVEDYSKEEVIIESDVEYNFNTELEESVSKEEQAEIDRIQREIERLDEINSREEHNYKLSEEIDLDLPEIESIEIPEIDTTIDYEPIDGTIKSTNIPSSACNSSVGKYLPECN